MMKIEVWSDFACPFCYIGKRHLEAALASVEGVRAEVHFRSFELDPQAPHAYEGNIDQLIARKYGIPEEKAREANARVIRQAAETGLAYDFANLRPSNTLDAHRLTKYAQAAGKEAAVTEALLRGYFTEGRQLSDRAELIRIASDAGLEPEGVREMLDSDAWRLEVRQDEAEAAAIGIHSVPFFMFNGRHALSGAQPVDVFVSAIRSIAENESLSDSGGGAVCTDSECR